MTFYYYSIKNGKLDGFRIIEDISYEDSVGRCFYVLPNGSYIYQTREEAYLYGEGFKIEKAAPLFCAGITTYNPMLKFLTDDMKTTGVLGCGGLGHMAIQFLHKLGKHVTAFTTSEKKTELLKQLGADKVVISTDPEQMKAAVNSIEFLINTIPNDIDFQQYVNCV